MMARPPIQPAPNQMVSLNDSRRLQVLAKPSTKTARGTIAKPIGCLPAAVEQPRTGVVYAPAQMPDASGVEPACPENRNSRPDSTFGGMIEATRNAASMALPWHASVTDPRVAQGYQ